MSRGVARIVVLGALACVASLALVGPPAAWLPLSVGVALLLGLVAWRAPVLRTRPSFESEPPLAPPPVRRGAKPRSAWILALAGRDDDDPPRALGVVGGAILVAILLVAGSLRLHRLADVPAGFFCDEASIGYNAYSILETGRDEHGMAFPLYFRAFGEYKNPVYIYSAVASIAAFGLDEFGTRFPAAAYGTLTVLLAFLVGRRLFGRDAGLVAAGLLAVSPWHVHFSRIAFELIALPFYFGLGLWLLLSGLARGSRARLVLAGLAFGVSLYTYAPARLFVPLFLAGFAVLFRRDLARDRRGAWLGLAALALAALPQVVYTLRNPERVQARWTSISGISTEAPLAESLRSVAERYASHFSDDFLFERGDPLKRHAVRGHGELYRSLLPWLALGLVAILSQRARSGWLLVWWLALFPVAASLTRETPTATRTIDAIPVFELIAAAGVLGLGRLLRARFPAWPALARTSALGLLLGLPVLLEFRSYLDAYFVEYPIVAAGGVDGFQHGYRDTVRYMERHRAEYDLLMLTATDVNQPEILALFYGRREPAEYQATRETGYRVSIPEEYGRYPEGAHILYALRPEDLRYFQRYTPRLRVVAPDGSVSFVVAEVAGRRPMLLDWRVLGLLPRGDGTPPPDVVDAAAPGRSALPWKAFRSPLANLDLNRLFADQAQANGGNPEHACAYLWTTVEVPAAAAGLLTIFGSPDPVTVWWNGARLSAFEPSREFPSRSPVALRPGANQLLIRSCENDGDWNLQVALGDAKEEPLPGLRLDATVPEPPR